MANEATKVELLGPNRDGEGRRFTIASSASVTKGALMQFADPRTAALCASAITPIAGILGTEKSNKDYSTSVNLWTDCIVSMSASQAITAGQWVKAASDVGTYPNFIMAAVATSTASGAVIFGYALDDIGTNETGNIRVRL